MTTRDGKNIILTSHAERQAVERNISLREIEKTLKHPANIVKAEFGGREIAQKVFTRNKRKYLYRVIFKRQNGGVLVITMYRTTKISKYLKEE